MNEAFKILFIIICMFVSSRIAFYVGYAQAMKRAEEMLDSAFEKKFKDAGVVMKKDDRIIECNGIMTPLVCRNCRFGRVSGQTVECFAPDFDGDEIVGIVKRGDVND